jgi:RNA polymerase sigma factor (sigma-70 family)
MPVIPMARLAAACSIETTADAELLHRYANGRDEAAFTALVRRHGPMVKSVARRTVRDQHLTDDIAQAVFLVLARKAGRLSRPDRLAGWLFGVTRRVAARAAAQHRDAARPLPANVSATTKATNWDDLLAVLDTELERLSEAERMPLVLCYLEGRTQDEAARMCGWSVRTLRRRLAAGRQRLRTRIDRRGLELGAVLMGLTLVRDLTADRHFAASQCHLSGPVPSGVGAMVIHELRAPWYMPAMAMGFCLVAGFISIAVAFPIHPTAPPPAANLPKAVAQAPAVSGTDLPAGAVALLGSLNLRHPAYLNSLRFSPDDKEVVTYGHGKVRRWDTRTGEAVKPVNALTDIVTTFGTTFLSADGTKVVAPHVDYDPAARVSVREHDLATGRSRECFKIPARPGQDGKPSPVGFTQFALSSDGRLLAEGHPADVYLWDLTTGKVRHHLELPGTQNSCLVFTPDSTQLTTAGGDGPSVQFWDVESGKQVEKLTGDDAKAGVRKLAISPDGQWVAAVANIHRLGEGTKVTVWDRTAGGRSKALNLEDGLGSYGTLAFAPDGPALYCVRPGRPQSLITRWDVAAGKEIARWKAAPIPEAGSTVAAISPDSHTLAVGSYSGSSHLYDTRTGVAVAAPTGHSDTVAGIAFDRHGLRTIGTDGSVVTWNTKTGVVRGRRDLPAGDRRGDLLAAVASTTVGAAVLTRVENRAGWAIEPPFVLACWDGLFGDKKQDWSVHAHTTGIGLSPDGAYAIAQIEGVGFRVLETATGKELPTVSRPHRNWTARFLVLPDSKTLVVCDAEAADGFDMTSGKALYSWKLADAKIIEPAAPSDTARPVYLRAIAASPDGKMLAIAIGGPAYTDPTKRTDSLVLVETTTGKVVKRVRTPDTAPTLLTYSADGKWVAGSRCIWDASTLAETRRFPAWPRVTAVAFGPDSGQLATGREDGTTMLWDVLVGK